MKLGPDIAMGERPQGVVPAGHWQAAESLGDWTLVGCTVAPGFQFADVRDGGAGLGAGQRMIPKSGYRFSEKIMRKETSSSVRSCPSRR